MPVLTEAMSLNIQLSGICGMTFSKAGIVALRVTALITISGRNASISSSLAKRCVLYMKRKRFWIGIENSRFVIKTQEVDKE